MAFSTEDPSATDRAVRAAVYRHFIDHGESPSTRALAEQLTGDEASIHQSLERLEAAHMLVLAPGTREVWMAHPFSAVPTPYPVETDGRQYWANCAWDALAIPTLLNVDARISTQCPDCGTLVQAEVIDGQLDAADEAVVHFLVRPTRFWDDIGFT